MLLLSLGSGLEELMEIKKEGERGDEERGENQFNPLRSGPWHQWSED